MNKLKIWMTFFASIILIALFSFFVLLICYGYDKSYVLIPVLVVILLTDILFAFHIISSPRYAMIKLCWVFVVLALPMIGDVIFVIFGTTPFKRKEWKEYNTSQVDFIKNEKFYKNNQLGLTADELNVFNFAKVNSFRPIYKNNKISVIKDNSDLYKTSIKLIRSAKKTIHIQMYIVHKGFWLDSLMNELIKKAKSGVKVRFIYDWVGCSKRFPKKYIKELKENGINVANFNPHGINIFKGATNFRSHRKGIIIDNKIALYGGSNIGDEYLSIDKKTNYFKDLNFIVEGEVVNTLNLLFCQDYCFMTDVKKGSKQYKEVYNNLDKILIPKKVNNKMQAQVVESSPDYEGKTIKNQVINLILKAKKSIDIITPYFFPTDDIVDCLIIASQSGIKVRLICPGQNDDKAFVTLLNRHNYKKMIDAKIKVYEFNGFIHSKLMVIDKKYVFTGSNNLDYRSLWINFENAILVKDTALANELSEYVNFTIFNSTTINQKFLLENTKKLDKLRISLMMIYYPLL